VEKAAVYSKALFWSSLLGSTSAAAFALGGRAEVRHSPAVAEPVACEVPTLSKTLSST